MRPDQIDEAVRVLRKEVQRWKVPAVGLFDGDPFLVLVSCIISLRTRDTVTLAASQRLFTLARDVESLAKLSIPAIQKAIYPSSFFRVKARTLQGIARDLIRNFGGKVPDTIDELLTLKGVGRKTANLVVTLGHRKPGICVDIHVHRISNRLGYVRTKNPDQTETALRAKLPKRYWMTYNDLLVAYGQNLCTPLSPWCSRCKLSSLCRRVGVGRAR